MADRQQLLQEFMSVTGANAERSQFYLEAAAWELHVALSSFYDEGEPDDDGGSLVQTTAAPATSSRPAQSGGDKSAAPGRFGTISSFKKDEEENSEDSEDEGQAFYAGGSESSGQQIIGPSKKKANPDKITQRIFDAAKRQGAEPVEDEVEQPRPRQRPAFVGAGYRLGSEPSTSEQVTASSQPPADQSNEPVNVRLKFWSNGFSLDDGPLRSFDDPNNRAFLNSIEKSEIPRELVQAARGSEVHVNIEDKRQEEYVKPKLKIAAFSGHGRMLGSPTPEIAANPPSPAASSSAPPPSYEVHVDEAQPITTLQIRLADGTRLVSKFNHTHTVADIRNMVRRARPGTGDNFVLMTTFPNKELTDDMKTIADSNLLNAVIVQRKR